MGAPRKINLGSGKDFRTGYLNLDVSEYWGPDIVVDASGPFLEKPGTAYPTRRFGNITLSPGSFDEIISHDVLEHVPDLVATMTNCLKLLREGGIFTIVVPYDLSYGAWQDPTHLRAFNERSWLYYTDWFWYLGWDTHRFTLRYLKFNLSPSGQALHSAGNQNDIILRTPRAVDSMQVVLEKIPLSDADRKALQSLQDKRQAIAGGDVESGLVQ